MIDRRFLGRGSASHAPNERKLNKQGRPMRLPKFQPPEPPSAAYNFQNLARAADNSPKSSEGQAGQSDFRYRAEIEGHFEDMMRSAAVLPLHSALEPVLPVIFRGKSAIIWVPKPEIEGFYAPTTGQTVVGDTTLVHAATASDKAIFGVMGDDDESRTQNLLFRLMLKDGTLVGVAQIVREMTEVGFADTEMKVAEIVMKKFAVYGSVLMGASQSVSFAEKFANVGVLPDVVDQMMNTLVHAFGCKQTDFYCSDGEVYMRYDVSQGEFVPVLRNAVGVALAALRGKTTVNVKAPRYHQTFSLQGDPLPDDPLLVCPFEFDGVEIAVALRGRATKEPFSADEVAKLESVMPFIAKSIVCSAGMKENGGRHVSAEEKKITNLLESVSAFSGGDHEEIVDIIQDKAMELVGAERCRLLIYDHMSNMFRTLSTEKQWIDVSASLGFVGAVIQSGQAMQSGNPTNEPVFDHSVDVAVDMDVKSIVAVPVFSSQNVIVGAMSLVNKKNGSPFDTDDVNVLVSFAVFCGIALENSNLIRQSFVLAKEIGELATYDSDALNNESDVLERILKQAKNDASAANISLYVSISDGSLVKYRSFGSAMKFGAECAGMAARDKAPCSAVFTESGEKATTPPKLSLHPSQPFTSNTGKIPLATPPVKPLLLVADAPVVQDSRVIGVLEISVLSVDVTRDTQILEHFAAVVAAAILRNSAKQMIVYSSEYGELSLVMSESEMSGLTCPPKLKTWPENLFTHEFDITAVRKEELLGVCFALFDKFGLMHEFELSAAKLFLLFTRIRANSYDLWVRAIESAVFLVYMITSSRLDERMKKHEIFCLLIAALCHNIDREYCKSAFNTKSNIALNILYSKQPVLEAHHCRKAISILYSPDVSAFASVNERLAAECVDLIIDLIMATDYQKHFDLIQEAKTLPEGSSPERMRLIMKLIVKCADVGVIARPEPVAIKYIPSICDEFLMQGPLTKLEGIIYKSENHTRVNIDKDRTAPIIFGSVFEPMFDTLAHLVPAFDSLLSTLESNEVKWWGQRGQQEPTSARSSESGGDSIEPAGHALGPDSLMELA